MSVIEARPLTLGKWLNLFEVRYVDRRGRRRTWRLASRSDPPKCVAGGFAAADAVVIAALHTGQRKMVVTREYRVPLAGYEYGFPAGLVDAGETPEAAARRELREETGLSLTRVLQVGPPIYSTAGLTDESVAMVYAECDGHPSSAGNEAGEDIEVVFVSRREAAGLCGDASLKFDAKAWLVLSAWASGGTAQFREPNA